jgi:hypothetical protein
MNQDKDRKEGTSSDGGTAPAKPDHRLPENRKESLDEKLDQGVEESFPASDPVSVKITK